MTTLSSCEVENITSTSLSSCEIENIASISTTFQFIYFDMLLKKLNCEVKKPLNLVIPNRYQHNQEFSLTWKIQNKFTRKFFFFQFFVKLELKQSESPLHFPFPFISHAKLILEMTQPWPYLLLICACSLKDRLLKQQQKYRLHNMMHQKGWFNIGYHLHITHSLFYHGYKPNHR